MKILFFFLLFYAQSGYILGNNKENNKKVSKIDFILIEKEKRLMSVFYKGELLKKYKIALGFSPQGHKEKEGDGKTPEGLYFISHKNPKSQFYLSLKVSYPNKKDLLNARLKGVSAGGDIMIHGLGKLFGKLGKSHSKTDWTLGCIAVTNEEIEKIYPSTPIGTTIKIKT